MRFLLRHWYDLGLALAIATLVWQAFAQYDGLRLILLLNLVVISLHQYEEYHWPGGGPWMINVVLGTKDATVDRYPLNQLNALLNNFVLWLLYLLPVIWPETIWLGLGAVLVGFGQLFAHGVQCNIKLKTWYNPGLATGIIGHVPLGIWYLVEVYRNDLISGWDWVGAIAYVLVVMGIIVGVGFVLMGNKTSPHPFAREELVRSNAVRHLTRLGIALPEALLPESHA